MGNRMGWKGSLHGVHHLWCATSWLVQGHYDACCWFETCSKLIDTTFATTFSKCMWIFEFFLKMLIERTNQICLKVQLWLKFAYVYIMGFDVVGKNTFLTHGGSVYHLSLTSWMFSKKRNQSVIISKTMIFKRSQYNFKM